MFRQKFSSNDEAVGAVLSNGEVTVSRTENCRSERKDLQ